MNPSMYSVSRQVVSLFTLAILCYLAQACKKDNEVDPGFGPNGEPRILSVKIADIPDQNIAINQDAKQITVTLPAQLFGRAA